MNDTYYKNKNTYPAYNAYLPDNNSSYEFCGQLKGNYITVKNAKSHNEDGVCFLETGKYLVNYWGLYKLRDFRIHEEGIGNCDGSDGRISLYYYDLQVTRLLQTMQI